jgi:Tol biopolymer transport system component
MPAISLERPQPVVPIRRHGWSKSAIVTVCAIVALAAIIFAWRPWRVLENTGALQAVPLFSLPGVSSYPSLSPDGNHVAFAWNGLKQDNPDIYVQQIGTGSPKLQVKACPRESRM